MESEPVKRSNLTKQALRKSSKRVDHVISTSTEFISAVVTKEGVLLMQCPQQKWKPRFFALCGSVLYWKSRESSTVIKGEISLKDAKIEKYAAGTTKTTFALKIAKEDKTLLIAAEKESLQEEWLADLQENADKPPASAPPNSGRKETRMLRAQKKVGGSIATSAAGKKIIREALGTEGYKGITIIKTVVTTVDGKKKKQRK